MKSITAQWIACSPLCHNLLIVYFSTISCSHNKGCFIPLWRCCYIVTWCQWWNFNSPMSKLINKLEVRFCCKGIRDSMFLYYTDVLINSSGVDLRRNRISLEPLRANQHLRMPGEPQRAQTFLSKIMAKFYLCHFKCRCW